MRIEGARVLIVGMARSGLAVARLLAARGAHVCATDLKAELPAELAAMGITFRPQAEESFAGYDLIVLSPGVAADLHEVEAAQRRGTPVVGEVEVASWFLRGPIIGVTGSNGKTTTTSMIGHILKECGVAAQVGGNIGTPLAAMVDSSRDDQWNVVELSSFQLETIVQFRAKVALVMNVTPDHLDRHGTFERYAAAKGRLLETQTADDWAILNADDRACLAYAGAARSRVMWFSSTRGVTPGLWLEDGWLWMDGEKLMEGASVPLRGLHNLENAMAAAGAAYLAGADREDIASAIRTFPGVEHRLEYVRTVRGADYYNDSKATNVDASLKAIAAFAGGLWIILGGKDKESDYTPLRAPLFARSRGALLVGAAAEKIERQLGGVVPVYRCGDMQTAVTQAHRLARTGDTVLLAPACASFDQFDNYEHRGRVFKGLVAELSEG